MSASGDSTATRRPGECAGEADLVRDARRGDPEAFAELVRRYQNRLWGFLASWVPDPRDREEIVQEVFLAAFRGIRRFRGQARFSTWLFQIAVNQARGHRRTAARRPREVEIDALDEPGATVVAQATSRIPPEPDQQAAGSETRDRLWRLVGRLPVEWQAAVRLRYVEDMTHPEIAHALDMPLGTVKVYLHRARKRLAELVIEEGLA